MNENGIKVKTMYPASHKHSFKWSVKDDILHLIQQQAPISNCFFEIKKQAWGTFVADVSLEIKIPGTALNKIFLIFQICCSIILLRMKSLKKKYSQVKILQNLRILPCQNLLVMDFFCKSDFALKFFYQKQSNVIYSRILCNIM